MSLHIIRGKNIPINIWGLGRKKSGKDTDCQSNSLGLARSGPAQIQGTRAKRRIHQRANKRWDIFKTLQFLDKIVSFKDHFVFQHKRRRPTLYNRQWKQYNIPSSAGAGLKIKSKIPLTNLDDMDDGMRIARCD